MKHHIILAALLIAVASLVNNCRLPKDEYYSAIGIGYIYDADSIIPMKNVEITITSALNGPFGVFAFYFRDTVISNEKGEFINVLCNNFL
ncbi:MAG: hypothetical protein LBP67_06085 [Bacteroidales bacterium]|jgi:hypothetical protein|nr:hypothetical protein [Bacteroidales bacterium]